MPGKVDELYKLWSENEYFSEEIRAELKAIADNKQEITERFYKYLEFGTGGLRGIIGAGTNRINTYTVAHATEGFARFLDRPEFADTERRVVISCDSRKFSREFAMVTALVFATHGIKVLLSDDIRPTPMLSFAVRHFKALGGVMITASHNPAKYNGYKAYGEDGGQMPPEAAGVILESMHEITDITSIRWMSEAEAFRNGLIEYFGEELDTAYFNTLKKLVIDHDAIRNNRDMKIVFTPLHGAGCKPVLSILNAVGFDNVFVVEKQRYPDPDFSTVQSPNPEERSALKMAIELAESEKADIVVATDPDGDRTGLVVRDRSGDFVVLSGNQIGLLLMDYILSAKSAAGSLTPKSFAVTTIVSSKLTRRIAGHYGIKLFEVLTGFKFIGEIVKEYDEEGDMSFEFAFEESYGYLAGKDVRDKDGVVTIMLISEMAASARSRGKTLYDVLQELYSKYGYAAEKNISVTIEGKQGIERIKGAMTSLRNSSPHMIGDIKIYTISDYLKSEIIDNISGEVKPLACEKSDVLLYSLGDDDWFSVRPSGTEPKLKLYFGIYGDDKDECEKKLWHVSEIVESHIRGLL